MYVASNYADVGSNPMGETIINNVLRRYIMKKILVGLMLAIGLSTAFADRGGHEYRGYSGGHNYWIAPLLMGAIGYELGRNQQQYYAPPAVYVNPPVYLRQDPVIIGDTNIVILNGIVYHKQMMLINGYWQEVLVQ